MTLSGLAIYWASRIRWPRPLVEAIISAPTIARQLYPIPTRTPTKMSGTAYGRTIYRKIFLFEKENVFPTSSKALSQPDIPFSIFRNMGKNADKKISSTFDSSPIPHHRISNGIILRGGIFRKKCIMGLVQAAKPLFIPFSNPSSIAEIKANVIPQATLCRLTSIALKSSPPEHSSKNVCRIFSGEGSK